MPDLEERIPIIEGRNARVEEDKAWETSWARRGAIADVTYVCAFILLIILEHDDAWKHAFVPVVAYLLSTFSLPPIRKIWLRQNRKEKV